MKNILISIGKFLISKKFLVNLLIAAAGFILLIGITYKWLEKYTNQKESITVPELIGLEISEIDDYLENKKFRYKVIDSSTYNPEVEPGTIIDQDPAPNKKVKENRTIYLSITRRNAPKVRMFKYKDVQLSQAKAILKSYGLKVGKQTYVPDIAENAVLDIKISGKSISEGTLVPKGSVVDLVIGDGFGDTTVELPDLIDMPLDEVTFLLQGMSLNLGAVIIETSDSANAKVYKQIPEYIAGERIAQGQSIDIFLK